MIVTCVKWSKEANQYYFGFFFFFGDSQYNGFCVPFGFYFKSSIASVMQAVLNVLMLSDWIALNRKSPAINLPCGSSVWGVKHEQQNAILDCRMQTFFCSRTFFHWKTVHCISWNHWKNISIRPVCSTHIHTAQNNKTGNAICLLSIMFLLFQ